jgi:hypothetical protein
MREAWSVELKNDCSYMPSPVILSWRQQEQLYLDFTWSGKSYRHTWARAHPHFYLYTYCGPGSSVGIATELRAGRSGDRIPVKVRVSALVQTGPGAHPTSYTMSTGSLPGVKSGRGVTLTPHPLLVPLSWKSRAIPLLPLWAVRPVQSLSACTRVTFTFTFTREAMFL